MIERDEGELLAAVPSMRGAQTSALAPVLQAKLRPSPNPEHLLVRPRLHTLIDESVTGPLTLVTAPAGAGKTSLLRSWVAETSLPYAWLSLDDTDRDPAQLWLAVLAALDDLAPGCAARCTARFHRRGAEIDAVAGLLDELERRHFGPRVLVLDDLHVLDGQGTTSESMSLFVQHLPHWLHVVASSRRTPPLPVDRLRVRGQLGEMHFAELRFSRDEATELVSHLIPDASAGRVEEIVTRADGWAAGLQLAALAERSTSAQPSTDPVVGDDTLLLENYVWNEVLAGEDEDVVEVLLAVAVSRRVDPRLAQVLAGRPDAPELLALAEARGLFVSRVEHSEEYEIHSLVREVMDSVQSHRHLPGLPALHARAATWFEEQGQVESALDHWLKSGQPRQALRLLASKTDTLYDAGCEEIIVRTIAALPTAEVATDFSSMVEYAWCNLVVDRQRLLESADYLAAWVHDDGAEFDDVQVAQVDVLGSVAATMRGDWDGGAALARKALAALDDTWMRDPVGKFAWNMVARDLALSERWDELSADVRRITQALTPVPERRNAIGGTRAIGVALAGRPAAALRLVAAARAGTPEYDRMTILKAELDIAEGLAHRELGEATMALSLLTEVSETRVEPVPYAQVLALLELTRLRVTTGNLESADDAFTRATEVVDAELPAVGGRDWLSRAGVELAVAHGDLQEASRWATQIVDPFWSAVSTARLLVASGDGIHALEQLEASRPRCVRHQVVKDLVMARATTDPSRAQHHLWLAVQEAAQHSIVQTVASEGPQVVEAIERLAWRAPQTWLDRLRRAAVPGDVDARQVRIDLVQALTDREIEVLRMLPSRLTLREIADELFISLNTLKFHLKVIYRKLQCGSREEAAEMARAMVSLHRSGHPPHRR